MPTMIKHIICIAVLLLPFSLRAQAGQLVPTNAPAPSMYTLTELYQQLTNALAEVQATQVEVQAAQAELQASQQYADSLKARLDAGGKYVTLGDMALIPAGSFVMGATTNVGHESRPEERPQHTVFISAFYMDRYEVTSNLWTEVYTWATNRGYAFGTGWRGKEATHPVHSVDWYDAIAWCNARSQRDGFTPCYTNADGSIFKNAAGHAFDGDCNWEADGYRLPTEAEWEKAARGGVVNRRFPWDDANTIQHARANYFADSSSYIYDTSPTSNNHPAYAVGSVPYTSPVGSFAANGYGLHDMAGNLYEWCWDRYDTAYYGSSPATDPRGPSTGTSRVMRGGSWSYDALHSRVAFRNVVHNLNYESYDIGFRCVRSL
jgi:formylglycine-generating enzyme required for sulfatase activity